MADTRTSTKAKAKATKVVNKTRVAKVKKASAPTEAMPASEASNESDDGDDDLSKRDFADLIEQVQSEYNMAWWFIKPKWDEWALRLKL
jgi:hypothetical protein